MTNRARKRQRITGERYMTALCHIRGECGRCAKGTPCEACLKDPCWTCRPVCQGQSDARFGKGRDASGAPAKCRFDDLLAPGKLKCAYCETVWPGDLAFSDAAKSVPMRPLPQPRPASPGIPLISITKTGRDPAEYHDMLNMADIRATGKSMQTSGPRISPSKMQDLINEAGKAVIPRFTVHDEVLVNPCQQFAKDDHVHEIVGSVCIRCNEVVR